MFSQLVLFENNSAASRIQQILVKIGAGSFLSKWAQQWNNLT